MTTEGRPQARLRTDAAYPDYVCCPHCGEPEVEVWSDEKTARCHNCARTFEVQAVEISHEFHELPRMGRAWFVKFVQFVAKPVVLLALAIGLAACNSQPYTFHGTLLEPPSPAADFALTDQNGAAFRLSEQTGKVALLYFGYTYCPDVCPATLAQFKRIKSELEQEAERVVFALVMVDPERDTPERLREYLAAFDPAFTGLTGAMGEMESVWQGYGVYQERQQLLEDTTGTHTGDHATGSYAVDHTARIFTVDTGGNLRVIYSLDAAIPDLASDIRQLLKEK
mgnify:FL=1